MVVGAPYGIKTKALETLCQIKEGGTDGWERYFIETGLFRVEYLLVEESLIRPEIRMTLDYQEDFEFFKIIFETLYSKQNVFSLHEVIQLIDSHPEIAQLSQKHSEEWYKKFKNFDIKIKLNNSLIDS